MRMRLALAAVVLAGMAVASELRKQLVRRFRLGGRRLVGPYCRPRSAPTERGSELDCVAGLHRAQRDWPIREADGVKVKVKYGQTSDEMVPAHAQSGGY